MDRIEEKKKQIKELWDEGKTRFEKGFMLCEERDIDFNYLKETEEKFVKIVEIANDQDDYENFFKFHEVGNYIETSQFLIGCCETLLVLAKIKDDLEKAKEELQKVYRDEQFAEQLVEFTKLVKFAKEIIEDIDHFLSHKDVNSQEFLKEIIDKIKGMVFDIDVLYPKDLNEAVSQISKDLENKIWSEREGLKDIFDYKFIAMGETKDHNAVY